MQHTFSVHFFAVVLHDYDVKLPETSKTLFTWSEGPRSSGVGFFCFVSPRAWKQKKPTPLDRGLPFHVNRPLVTRFMEEMSYVFLFTAAHFRLALVTPSIPYLLTATTKFSCCSSNKKKAPLDFLSLALDLSRPFSRWVSLACRLLSLFLCLCLALISKLVDMTINLSLKLQTTQKQKQFLLSVFVFIDSLAVSALQD